MTDRVPIGKILSPHGIKGEVKVFPWTDDPERFRMLDEVFLVKDTSIRPVHLVSSRGQKKLVILKFREITSANEAELLKGWQIEIDKKDLLPLPEGRYYIFQLIGLQVRTLDGQDLGVLSEVLQTGANDVYVVKNEVGREVLLPALKSVVKKVDLDSKQLLADPLPGLLD